MDVFSVKFEDYPSIEDLLSAMAADKIFKKQKRIILKPNLVTNKPYPITTDPAVVEEIIKYIKDCSKGEIIIAEGSGDDTIKNYKDLGYESLGKKYNLRLIDLNYTEVEILENPNARVLKEFYFPKILKDSYIISIANLKEHHSEAKVTFTLKNMFGIGPGQYYSFNIRGRPWTKETFHDLGINDSIIDINTYRLPDMGIVDGRIAVFGTELGGSTKKHGRIYGSYNCIALDAFCAKILGHNPRDIKYIEELSYIYRKKKEGAM